MIDSWTVRAAEHRERADALTARWRARKAAGAKHAIDDFLFEYYPTRPSLLARWHPGVGFELERPADLHGTDWDERLGWRWYALTQSGGLRVDAAALMRDRGAGIGHIHELLQRTAGRPAQFGCFGLHEWAMVYRQGDEARRHRLPLRLTSADTDAVVESRPLRCSHFDAFRFFTSEAVPLNERALTRESQLEVEQPGCLHANMDLYRAALKLGPAIEGSLLLDCFELARDIRQVDMQASPYDVSRYGLPAVEIETPAGRAEYVRHQRVFAERAEVLRARLIDVTQLVMRTG